jgi:transposase-like protein
MVHEAIEQSGESFGVIPRIARQLGIGSESPRTWVRQDEVEGAGAPAPRGASVALSRSSAMTAFASARVRGEIPSEAG